MNTDAHIEDARQTHMPAGLRGLWGEACEWVGWLLGVFDRDRLRTTGIKRETGARLGIWLMNIEGGIRRLVLAAALLVAPPAPRKQPACAAARTHAVASARRPGFCVFRLCGAGEARPTLVPALASNPKPYGHIPFRPDPLLVLGNAPARAAQAVRNAPRSPRRNPLDRWGRLSRHDPDWRPPEDKPPRTASPSRASQAQAELRPRKSHAPCDPTAQLDSLQDWRRRHDEWDREIPAPDLAKRLEALAHVIADPTAAIARAARRMRAVRAQLLPLARATGALTDKPRRAAHIASAGHTEAFASRCQDALVRLDTS